jgi:hypothetical protein
MLNSICLFTNHVEIWFNWKVVSRDVVNRKMRQKGLSVATMQGALIETNKVCQSIHLVKDIDPTHPAFSTFVTWLGYSCFYVDYIVIWNKLKFWMYI